MTANSTPESFDAVLADVMGAPVIEDRHFDRLAAAHAAEVAEQQAQLNHANYLCSAYRARIAELEVAYLHYRPLAERAEAATALLRECLQFVPSNLAARIAGLRLK